MSVAIPEAARRNQARASDPRASAWVSANAGSGKTTVLTRRVLRLLLAGHDPGSLLCLTFTKAAAAEMAQRVFDELARWTRLDNADLAVALGDLEPDGGRIRDADLRAARSLFARALETPGGLKIQTIHAFCESLLHQFPLEANVPASFTVLDERDAARLKQEARDTVIARAASGHDPVLGQAFEAALERTGDATLEGLIDAILDERHALLTAFDAAGVQTHEERRAHLLAVHGAHIGLSDADRVGDHLRDPLRSSPYLPRSTIEALWDFAHENGTATDQKNAALLHTALTASDVGARVAAYRAAFFNASGDARKFGRYFGKALLEAFPDALDRVEDEQKRASALFAQKSYADLMTLALAALQRFDALKARVGALDFDDLIARTAALLTRSEARAWVRYKMDQRIDHILVDEAQDTSPQQWAIITALSDEFFAGEGTRGNAVPTFFAVGDDKQSIYSFQGADPRHFEATRRSLETKAAQAAAPLNARVPLTLSFRSSPDILSAVDTVFEQPQARKGVGAADVLVHEAHKTMPGLVEIWPVIIGSDAEEPADWTQPLDLPDPPHQILAQAIASWVARHLREGGKPSDVLILLRTRGGMLDTINRALKRAGVPVAGADRLTLTDHIAVEDLIMLMRAVLLPEDDLALATMLKSPLLGLDDGHLERLCVDRPGFLIDALNAPSDDPAIRLASERFANWRAMADISTPFVFLSLVLGRDGGRRALMERLGEDARDPLDEVLRLARAEEQRLGTGLASLQAFTDGLARTEITIKRDMEARSDTVRIMTVHGSKGLEADTVFLVDTCRPPRAPTGLVRLEQDAITELGANQPPPPPVVALRGGPEALAYADDKAKLSERQMEEYRRLLYVAMTRAKTQLIVTGHVSGKKGSTEPHRDSWYSLIDEALGTEARDVGAQLEGVDAAVRQWRAKPWSDEPSTTVEPDRSAPDADEDAIAALRALIIAPLPVPEQTAPLRPSSARRDAQLSAQDWAHANEADRHLRTVADLDPSQGGDALAFGTLVHGLLEHQTMPHEARARALAQNLKDEAGAALGRHRIEEALDQALAVRAMPEAAALFPSNAEAVARGEVPLRGRLRDARGAWRLVSGSIDRLVIGPDSVLAVDFKTNARPPDPHSLADTVPDYCAQMALYAALLQSLYPDRMVRCGLLWTSVPRLDWLSDDLLTGAMGRLGLEHPINTA